MPVSSLLSDDQIGSLLHDYFAESVQDDWPEKLRSLVKRVRETLLKEQALSDMSDDSLVDELVSVYREIVRVPMYYKAIVNHPQPVRAAIVYLLTSTDDLETKIDAVLKAEGSHYRKGLGKAFWSLLFMALDPSRNPYWNNKTEYGLASIGMDRWSKSDSPGIVYRHLAEAQHALVKLDSRADLYAIDHFMHYVTVLDGKETIQGWLGDTSEIEGSGADEWANEIAKWRKEHLPTERVETRQEAEGEAKDLLRANLGAFDEEMLRRFFELVNADYYGGSLHRDRFSPGFVGAYVNRIAEQLEVFNNWVPRLWECEESEVASLLDTFWDEKPIAYAGTSLPTVLLYLRDPQQYAVWLRPMAQGVKRLTGLEAERESGDTYLRYSSAVADLRRRYRLHPQEMDVILVLASRDDEPPIASIVAASDGFFTGFKPDTFAFLHELQDNNNTEWMQSNEKRYQQVLREPLRALFKDVAPVIGGLDPNLETEAKFGRVMATVKKRWPDDKGDYYIYLWGAFYRADRTKQTDAQLYIIVHPENVTVGIGAGKGAQEALQCFRKNVIADPELFYRFLEPLAAKGLVVTTYKEHGQEDRELVEINSPQDVIQLANLGFVDIGRDYGLEDDILYSGAFAKEVGDLFTDLYPLYRFFISEDLTKDVLSVSEEEPDYGIEEEAGEQYTLEQLQAKTFLASSFLFRLEALLQDKGQIVLYGPPGTGKTFVAKEFANFFVDQTGGDVQVVQFHPSYAYEEFVEGIRPRSEKNHLIYPVEAGVFRRLCDEARRQPKKRFVLIIDEINRGNLPRIFGELLYLLEYRNDADPVVLPYSRTRFTVPGNIFLIGTMNTADRSIALVDHALRRRFHFVPLKSDPDILRAWLEHRGEERMAWVADLLVELNQLLQRDHVDWHLHIGHSHWMVRAGRLDEERARLIWEHSIMPTLAEYFYNRQDLLPRYDYEKLRDQVLASE